MESGTSLCVDDAGARRAQVRMLYVGRLRYITATSLGISLAVTTIYPICINAPEGCVLVLRRAPGQSSWRSSSTSQPVERGAASRPAPRAFARREAEHRPPVQMREHDPFFAPRGKVGRATVTLARVQGGRDQQPSDHPGPPRGVHTRGHQVACRSQACGSSVWRCEPRLHPQPSCCRDGYACCRMRW